MVVCALIANNVILFFFNNDFISLDNKKKLCTSSECVDIYNVNINFVEYHRVLLVYFQIIENTLLWLKL